MFGKSVRVIIGLFVLASIASAEVPGIIGYQGRVTVNGAPYDGMGCFKFAIVTSNSEILWSNDGTIGTNLIPGSAVSLPVNEGMFSVGLGDTKITNMNVEITPDVFENSEVYLRIWFSSDGVTFNQFAPDRRILVVGYAMEAAHANETDHADVADTLTGFDPALKWGLSGNVGTTAGTDFLGTTDNQALELKVSNQRAMRLEPNTESPNVIGGHNSNSVTAGKYGATISGGRNNRITENYGTVSGGYINEVTASFGVVSGGKENKVGVLFGTVAGGYSNYAGGNYSTIAGGYDNYIGANYGTVAGGYHNSAGGNYGTVAGGYYNSAGGNFGTVAGGYLNLTYGDYSFAAGRRAQALHDGSFVWGDSTDADVRSTGANQFVVRANGGTFIHGDLDVSGGAEVGNLNFGTGFFGTSNNQALDFRVNNQRAMRLEPNTESPNVIGGHNSNSVTAGKYGASIGGGCNNRITENYGTVSGGYINSVTASFGVVSGGDHNRVNGLYGTIAGGQYNYDDGNYSTIAGGYSNYVEGDYSIIGGGYSNYVEGDYSIIGGGRNNNARGYYSTVAGGYDNYAHGDYSFAAGRRAKSMHDGSFVWGDRTNADIQSTGANQFVVRANGGTFIHGDLDVSGTAEVGNLTVTGTLTADTFKAKDSDHADNADQATNSDHAVNADHATNADQATNAGHADVADALTGFDPNSKWGLTGNSGTTPGTDFLGTTDNQALELKVNGQRAMRLEPNSLGPNVIGGFSGNSVTSGLHSATIAGGYLNQVTKNYGTIAGGVGNTVSGARSFVGGGNDNIASGDYGTVAGGLWNTASGEKSTVGGGLNNTASGLSSTIGGGYTNTASGEKATVGGGLNNTASGLASTVTGGSTNSAEGTTSFAAGNRAKALHNGCFVWGDNTAADVASTGTKQFIVRSAGGVFFYTNSALTSGVQLAAGGGSWSSVSDRDMKENFVPIDGEELLTKLDSMPITEYNLITQDDSIVHIGPVSQDFAAIFGYGENNERRINNLDAIGVSLAANQANYRLLKQKDIELKQKDQEIQDLKQRLSELESLVHSLANKIDP